MTAWASVFASVVFCAFWIARIWTSKKIDKESKLYNEVLNTSAIQIIAISLFLMSMTLILINFNIYINISTIKYGWNAVDEVSRQMQFFLIFMNLPSIILSFNLVSYYKFLIEQKELNFKYILVSDVFILVIYFILYIIYMLSLGGGGYAEGTILPLFLIIFLGIVTSVLVTSLVYYRWKRTSIIFK